MHYDKLHGAVQNMYSYTKYSMRILEKLMSVALIEQWVQEDAGWGRMGIQNIEIRGDVMWYKLFWFWASDQTALFYGMVSSRAPACYKLLKPVVILHAGKRQGTKA